MTMVLKMILMEMMTIILLRRWHQVFFVIYVHYSFLLNYYCHLDVGKSDFPLDEKDDSDEDDDSADDDDDDHSHSQAKTTLGIPCYIYLLFVYIKN
jgi:hypothetical protein